VLRLLCEIGAQVDARDLAGEFRAAGDGAGDEAGAAAKIEHRARGIDVHGVEIVGEGSLEERMNAPHLQALDHDVEHIVVELVGSAKGVELGHENCSR
jgi:hypothetical protein